MSAEKVTEKRQYRHWDGEEAAKRWGIYDGDDERSCGTCRWFEASGPREVGECNLPDAALPDKADWTQWVREDACCGYWQTRDWWGALKAMWDEEEAIADGRAARRSCK